MKMIQFPMKLPELPPGFGLRWQAKRDTALVRTWKFSRRHAVQKRRRRCALPAQSKQATVVG
jgi:hypothetical protein